MIIGAGAVVKGIIPANSIIAGNPAKIIGNTKEFGSVVPTTWSNNGFCRHFETGSPLPMEGMNIG